MMVRRAVWILAVAASWMAPMTIRAEENSLASDRPLTMIERGILVEINDLLNARDFTAADQRLREVIARNPELLPARKMHAAVLISLNRYEEAIAILDAITREFPSDHGALNNLSWVLSTATDQRFRNPARALQLAQDSVLIAPGDYHVWSTLAEAHLRNANYDQAVKSMTLALDLAVRAQAGADQLESYREQMNAMQETAAIMSLMEQ